MILYCVAWIVCTLVDSLPSTQSHFHFCGVHIGSERLVPFAVINRSPAAARLTFNLSQYPNFSLQLPQPAASMLTSTWSDTGSLCTFFFLNVFTSLLFYFFIRRESFSCEGTGGAGTPDSQLLSCLLPNRGKKLRKWTAQGCLEIRVKN